MSAESIVKAQSTSATLTGTVEDQNGAIIVGASVTVLNINTRLQREATTNEQGYFTVALLPPSTYTVTVRRDGFAPTEFPNVVLNVGDQKSLQIQLKAGAVTEMVRIEGGAPLINESPAVATVVDRQFVENLPLNGRSFQSLIQLTPGVVTTPVTALDGGQFSINGQRAASNYWMVDGVGANIGIGAIQFTAGGNGPSGSLGSFSALGGTNSLVSVDALQEFRIQTSSYAAEFGRQPGGQISISTRSGTNKFSGSVFDYLRNDVLDAQDWFANANRLEKPRTRQNDFGGTFSGPILKDRTFFFFSYEGLRLRLPRVALSNVPSVSARENAIPVMRPFLNAYPQPNGLDLGNGTAEFNASFSNSATLDATSIRIDHTVSDKLSLFGRYNHAPSEAVQRGTATYEALSRVPIVNIKTKTATLGATWTISPNVTNDLRFNYSRTRSSLISAPDNFGGAVPLASLPFPSGFTNEDSVFAFGILSLGQYYLDFGKATINQQRQFNIVDNLLWERGSHTLKFGADFRRLTPRVDGSRYGQIDYFGDVASAQTGALLFGQVYQTTPIEFLFRNLGVYAQDNWRVNRRLTFTYGVRWDVEFPPTTANGPKLPAAVNFNDLATVGLAPEGSPVYDTRYNNFAPRLGVSYQLLDNPKWGTTVLRGGFGIFYDLATQEIGTIFQANFPFGAAKGLFGGTFPLDAESAAPPPITILGGLSFFDPKLRLPRTYQWNLAFEQSLGQQQTLSASYVGAAGRRLIQSVFLFPPPNPAVPVAYIVWNNGSSDYHALQLQFQRRLSRGIQALGSYTWSHSIDTGSGSSYATSGNAVAPNLDPRTNRGSSSFDIRHAFSAAISYDIPAIRSNGFLAAITRDWSLHNTILARSAPPLNLSTGIFFGGALQYIRPDVIEGIPLYLYGSQYPGGKIINNTPDQGGPGCKGPFCPPPADRQGTLGRNALRGFGAFQWDLALHRSFRIRESLGLQLRAEMFNVLNHPNFGPPDDFMLSPTFGTSTQSLAQSLGGGTAGIGGFNPLYQIGGPRSIQLGLKLTF